MWSFRSLLILSIIAARVVDFPVPVGPVTSTNPLGFLINSLTIGGMPNSARLRISKEMARKALSTVGLEERGRHHPSQLSGGEQQRVAIARALVNQPSILLADEPTGNLDSKTSEEIMGIFQRLNREMGITIIMITHEPDIASFAKRNILFKDGRIVDDHPNSVRTAAAWRGGTK